MNRTISLAVASLIAFASQASAELSVACTLALETESNDPLVLEGNCDQRISPASTFKIPISLMAFDSGILLEDDSPEWPFEAGYSDWNPQWRRATTPASWMRDSVVWYSQRAAQEIGAERFGAYVEAFGYGNQDISGDKGEANGMTNAWLSSSLQISPVEQVAFLTRMIEGKLPVDDRAIEQTKKLVEFDEHPDGWQVFGKTGAGMPFGEDGELLRGQPFGWYVGWAEKAGRTVVFAHLVRFNQRPDASPGVLAREGVLRALFGPGGALD